MNQIMHDENNSNNSKLDLIHKMKTENLLKLLEIPKGARSISELQEISDLISVNFFII